jgi:hypothetical protein
MLTAASQSPLSGVMQPSCGRLRLFTRPVLYRTRVLALEGACLTSASLLHHFYDRYGKQNVAYRKKRPIYLPSP